MFDEDRTSMPSPPTVCKEARVNETPPPLDITTPLLLLRPNRSPPDPHWIQVVSQCLKDPALVLRLPYDAVGEPAATRIRLRLVTDIELCCATDHVFSPYVDGLRTSVGKEYEVRRGSASPLSPCVGLLLRLSFSRSSAWRRPHASV